MYLPDAFRLDDRQTLFEQVIAHPFATLISLQGTGGDGGVSHLPLLLDGQRGLLRGHLARANPQVAHLAAGSEMLAIFHGPHTYVSPSVYEEHPSVPTWNYVVVHVRGRGRLVDEMTLRSILEDMVRHFDPTGWRFQAPEDYVRSALDSIAGFEIPVERLEGKFKLSQNRSRTDQERVAEWLEHGDEASKAVAALMRTRF